MAQQKPNWEAEPPRDWEEEQAFRVGNEVKRLRGKRSAQWLSDRTRELGCSVTRTVISDIEVGRRRYITVSELIILARALDTAPIALLYPFPYFRDGKIKVLPTPKGEQDRVLDKIVAVQWFTGVLNIVPLDSLGMDLVDQSNYFANLRGLERARKVFALFERNQKLNVRLGQQRRNRREGDGSVTDEEVDELIAEIEDNQNRMESLLALGDRDLAEEVQERQLREFPELRGWL